MALFYCSGWIYGLDFLLYRKIRVMKYTLEEVIEELKKINLVSPYHIEMVSNGHGEFPDSYKLTEQGAQRLKETLVVRLTI